MVGRSFSCRTQSKTNGVLTLTDPIPILLLILTWGSSGMYDNIVGIGDPISIGIGECECTLRSMESMLEKKFEREDRGMY